MGREARGVRRGQTRPREDKSGRFKAQRVSRTKTAILAWQTSHRCPDAVSQEIGCFWESDENLKLVTRGHAVGKAVRKSKNGKESEILKLVTPHSQRCERN